MKELYYEINNGFRFFRSENLDFPFHLHDDVELIYCLKGSANAFCDDKEYTIKQGDFFLVFPKQVHYYYNSSADSDFFVIILNTKYLGDYTSAFFNAVPESALYHYDCADIKDNVLLSLLHSAWDDYTGNEQLSTVILQITLIIVKLLNRYSLQKHPSSERLVCKIVQYCSDHYSEMISVSDICENLNVSRSYVSHFFKNKLKIGFCDYINTLRLNDAEHLLKSTNDSVTSIAFRSGFSTLRTFNRVFLKKNGVSPTVYRNDYLKSLIDSKN